MADDASPGGAGSQAAPGPVRLPPGPAGPRRAEAQEFADALLAFLAAARRTRGRLQPLFDDVTVPQLVLLDAVDRRGAEGIAAVARFTALSQPTVTRSTATLEQSGLLRRELAGDDGRRRVLTLTPLGRALLDDKRAVVAGHLLLAWERLRDDERDLAAPLLRRLAGLVEDLL